MAKEGKRTPKPRSHFGRQRRLAIRLSVSTETLLRLTLRLPLPAELSHTLPLRPSVVVRLLEQLAAGVPIEELDATGDFDGSAP